MPTESTAADAFVPTGDAGLDEILRGGYPAGRVTVLDGPAGSGKTTLGLQAVTAGRDAGHRCVLVTIGQSPDELGTIARSHGLSLEGVHVAAPPEDVLGGGTGQTIFRTADLELRELGDWLRDLVERERPDFLLLDALSALRILADGPWRYRQEVLAIRAAIHARGVAAVLLDDASVVADAGETHSLVDAVIRLGAEVTPYGHLRRRIRVDKARGVDVATGSHDVIIRRGGVQVFPRLLSVKRPAKVAAVSQAQASGLPELDEMLGGGIPGGSNCLIVGPSGVGKSTLASLYLDEAARRGVRSATFLFEERRAVFLERARDLGLHPGHDGDEPTGVIRTVGTAEMAPDQFSSMVRAEVEDRGVGLVVLDSLSGYFSSMPYEALISTQLHDLLEYLGDAGVMTILVMAQHGTIGERTYSEAEVSFMSDAVIAMRYFEAEGRVRKAITVVKKRTGGHASGIREFEVTGGGVRIGPVLATYQGVLTGTPVITPFEPKMPEVAS